MDQNTTALLAALIGGFLSAGGGFLANYYIQSASKRNDKQKGIRNMIESVYKEIVHIEDSYQNILDLQDKHSQPPVDVVDYDPYSAYSYEIAFNNKIAGEVDSIEKSMKNIDLLVALYLSPLQDAFSTYQDRVVRLIEVIRSGTSNPEDALSKEDLEKIGKQFQLSLSTLLKKKGYSYL